MTSMTSNPADVAQSAPAPSADTLRVVERTLRTLLSPLDHPDWTSWRDAAHRQLLTLPGVDALSMHTPLGDELTSWLIPHVDTAALRSFATELHPHDITERRLIERGVEAAHQSELVDRTTLERNIVYAEFVAPHRLQDTTLALLDLGGGAQARLWFTGASRSPWEPDPARVALIRTILPAVRAGLSIWQRVGTQRADLARLLDTMRDAVLVYATSGELLHANPAAARLFASANSERIRAAAQQTAWGLGALVRRARTGAPAGPSARVDAGLLGAAGDAAREVRSGATVYRLRATLAPETMLGREPAVLVTVETVAATALTDADLRDRFGLTPREIVVSRLVAEGLTNQEIGDRLGMSFFTARNHVERVLSRTGATTRARVGTVLRGEGA